MRYACITDSPVGVWAFMFGDACELDPKNIRNVKLREKLMPEFHCQRVDGAIIEYDHQIVNVHRFDNLIEYFKIKDDEIITHDGNIFVTDLFFKRRQLGWKSDYPEKKYGQTVGYFINNKVCVDKNYMEDVCKGYIYWSVVRNHPVFIDLFARLRDNVKIFIDGPSEACELLVFALKYEHEYPDDESTCYTSSGSSSKYDEDDEGEGEGYELREFSF